MLKIRLARGGAKKRPYYSIVVADSHSPRDGRFIEKVGAYNPLLKRDDPKRITLDSERISQWLAKGAQPTDQIGPPVGRGVGRGAPRGDGQRRPDAPPHGQQAHSAQTTSVHHGTFLPLTGAPFGA